MVKFWDVEIDRAIKITKMRIKHMEKHGMGKNAMQEKEILKKQERNKELRALKK